jgi:hypothetical protein
MCLVSGAHIEESARTNATYLPAYRSVHDSLENDQAATEDRDADVEVIGPHVCSLALEFTKHSCNETRVDGNSVRRNDKGLPVTRTKKQNKNKLKALMSYEQGPHRREGEG